MKTLKSQAKLVVPEMNQRELPAQLSFKDMEILLQFRNIWIVEK